MGPRPRSRGCLRALVLAQARERGLQWGRGLAAADVAYSAGAGPRVLPASMGPRPRSRGCLRRYGRDGPRPPCFNGAAASQPRMSPRIGACSRTLPRFNGAAASQPRMSRELRRMRSQATKASMGPRPRSRGCTAASPNCVDDVRASMGPRPRSRGCSPFRCAAGSARCSFNGAAASQPRM